MHGAFLIEAGSKHFVAEFDTLDVTGGPACAPTGKRPPFRRTTDKSLRKDVSMKRGGDEVEMAIRDGKLVVVRTYFGGGRYCKSHDSHAYDFIAQSFEDSHQTEKDFVSTGVDSCKSRDSADSKEALLLVTNPGVSTATRTAIARGKASYTGAGDASFQVAVTQPTKETLEIRVQITDDVARAADERSAAALGKADHVAVWIGRHSVKLARDASGAWFAIGDATTVAGEPNDVRITVPFSWAGWKQTGGALMGSLVVAYYDVDDAGEPTVVATAPVTSHPRGMLMKLPGAARWPLVGKEVPSPFNADGECPRGRN